MDTIKINVNIEQPNPAVQDATFAGEIKLLSYKFDNLMTNMKNQLEKLSLKLDRQSELFDKYLTKEEFNAYVKEISPVVVWATNRIAIEKFIIGAVTLLGVSQTIMIVVLAAKLLSKT